MSKKKIITQIFFIFNLIKIISNECPIDKPILKHNDCYLIYCDENKCTSGDCLKSNTIIKTQWLTNVIRISDNIFKNVNIVLNTKGVLFAESSLMNQIGKRIIFGLKNNGIEYIHNKETNKETFFYIIEHDENNLERQESDLLIIKLNNQEKKEYLMSISNYGM